MGACPIYILCQDFSLFSFYAELGIIDDDMEHATYRIIDANFNRAREAARVIEEFCRFALNRPDLSGRAKQLRHELSAAVDKLDIARLISSRDTLSDVGVGQKVDNQLHRVDIYDSFVAACKRLTEALRALTETVQSINLPIAEEIESLRYASYTLEKDIVLVSNTVEKFKRVKLYVIITSNLPADVISLTHSCVAGGADCIQLRAKDITDDRLFAVATEFVRICKDSSVLSIINDRADIAVAAGADGLHLGQSDLPIAHSRRLQLTPLIIGKSTHSVKQLKAACEENPTYVSLGPVFSTPTKAAAEAVGLDYVKQAAALLAETGISHVAIGGITLENVNEVLAAGAQAIAVCSAISKAKDAAAACRKLKNKITSAGKQ